MRTVKINIVYMMNHKAKVNNENDVSNTVILN